MIATRLADAFARWLDIVAEAVAAGLDRLRRGHAVRIVERDDGRFALAAPQGGTMALPPCDPAGPEWPQGVAAMLKGRPVELVLSPRHFLFRPLELPGGALPFLSGIVRAQIDRLTPWTANDALFGWTVPAPVAGDRIRLRVAATPRARIAPCLNRLQAGGARSIAIVTLADAADGAAPIRILDHAGAAGAGAARIRAGLLAILAASALAATLAAAIGHVAVASLDAELETLDRSTAEARRVIAAAQDGQGADPATSRLEHRKREVPATVLVVDALSEILPDDTHLTGLDLDGNTLRITGVSPSAAGLIRLLEQSRKFAQATFVAPTTPLPEQGGERFEIEARVVVPQEAGK